MNYSLQIIAALFVFIGSLSAQPKSIKELDRSTREAYKHHSINGLKFKDGDTTIRVWVEKKDNQIIAVRKQIKYTRFNINLSDSVTMCQFNYINDSLLRVFLVKKSYWFYAYILNDKIIAVYKSDHINVTVEEIKEKSEQFRTMAAEIVNRKQKD
ncbi:MAG: hypothetical protein QM726_14760 [Chitinophagaceae bacterium]